MDKQLIQLEVSVLAQLEKYNSKLALNLYKEFVPAIAENNKYCLDDIVIRSVKTLSGFTDVAKFKTIYNKIQGITNEIVIRSKNNPSEQHMCNFLA